MFAATTKAKKMAQKKPTRTKESRSVDGSGRVGTTSATIDSEIRKAKMELAMPLCLAYYSASLYVSGFHSLHT